MYLASFFFSISAPALDLSSAEPALPPECWLRIFSYLSPHDVRPASQVCKIWKDFSDAEALWKQLFISRFGSVRLSAYCSPEWLQQGLKYAYQRELEFSDVILQHSAERAARARALAASGSGALHDVFCTFVGEAGAGKTSLCYVLANQCFLSDYVPTLTEVVSLNLSSGSITRT